MPAFAPGKYAIAICGRCGLKYPYKELIEDGNIKGLYVCNEGCRDDIDPYKLPPRGPDNFVLHHPRPDAPLNNIPTTLTLPPDGEVVSTNINDTYTP